MSYLKSISLIFFALVILPFSGKTQHYFISNGTEIHYNITGKGDPVVLIHGFTENIQVAWEQPIAGKAGCNTLKSLAGNFQAIAIDVRGTAAAANPLGNNIMERLRLKMLSIYWTI